MASTTHEHRMHVLVVEDEPALGRMFVRALRAPGVRVELVSDAAAALAALDAVAPDVLWTDLHLGHGPDGIDLLAAAARRWPDAMLLLVTSSPGTARARMAPEGVRVFDKHDFGAAIELVRERASARRRDWAEPTPSGT